MPASILISWAILYYVKTSTYDFRCRSVCLKLSLVISFLAQHKYLGADFSQQRFIDSLSLGVSVDHLKKTLEWTLPFCEIN